MSGVEEVVVVSSTDSCGSCELSTRSREEQLVNTLAELLTARTLHYEEIAAIVRQSRFGYPAIAMVEIFVEGKR